MYYSIFIRNDYLEYHVSSVKAECEQGQSMSRRVNYLKADGPAIADYVEGWHKEAAFYNCTPVTYQGGQ